tara:strand:- start:986 stop:2218 length:1233 start_codon:yes stop_codon:yes gene_type:complete
VEAYTEWVEYVARPSQLTPKDSEDWNIWLILAGRGWGKTRTGAMDALIYAMRHPDVQVAVVTPTFGDLKRTAFEGPSGILRHIPEGCLMRGRGQGYNSSGAAIKLANGSQILGFSATEPDRLRGPQFHRAWCDELAAWRYTETFDQLMFSLRLGSQPKCIITTTPRPTQLVQDLIKRDDTIVTRGSTFENAENLADSTLKMLREKYEGTTLGRQELYAEIIDKVEGALWTPNMIDDARIPESEERELTQIVIAIDPAVTANEKSDETGIVVCGKDSQNHFFVLEDASGKYTPDGWAREVVRLFYEWQADRCVAEVNNGGDLVERLLRSVDKHIPYRAVHATRGKLIRAEPVSALYEQGRVHHLGSFPALENQMCTYTADRNQPSPDRLDALVWGISEMSKSSGNPAWRIS